MDIGTTEVTYAISKHAAQRFAERLRDRDNSIDINRFVIEHEDRIKTDLNKMILHGELLYGGKQTGKNASGNIISVYLCDTWIILADSKLNNIITVYKIDLGCGDEFNNEYISRMKERLCKHKEELLSINLQVTEESSMYKELISDATTQINNYKSMIRNLEHLCEGYQSIIDNNKVNIAQANLEIANDINTMISKKEF
jgi:hypothetical protein